MTRRAPVLVIGAGGHARELIDLLEAADPTGALYQVIGVLTSQPVEPGPIEQRGLVSWVGAPSSRAPGALRLLAIGQGSMRREMATDLGGPALSLCHPSAAVEPSVVTAEGFVAAAGATVEAGAVIGAHVHLNTNTAVGPNSHLEAFVTLSPGAAIGARAVVGEGTFVGAGARLDPGVHIGAGCVVGAGALVCRDIPAGAVVVGRPARAR